MKATIQVITAVGTLWVATSAQAATLSLVPASSFANSGDPVAVQLWISGLGDGSAPSLGTFDLTLGFDPSILNFTSFFFGDPILGDQLDLGGFGSIQGVDNSVAGQLNLFEISTDLASDLDTLQASEFALGTLSFTAIGLGTSLLEFITVPLLGDADGNELQVTTEGGSIRVEDQSTPVPDRTSTALLLAIGLVGLVACLRSPGFARNRVA